MTQSTGAGAPAAAAGSTLSEVDRLTHVIVKHAREAFVDDATIRTQWKALDFSGPPDFGRACAESDQFVELLQSCGVTVHLLPADPRATLDSIYVHDASVPTPRGLALARMGKPAREAEPAALETALATLSAPGSDISGRITAPGTLEGGDVVWLHAQTVAVGEGYRTNAAGIRQLAALLGPDIEVVAVPLPHWRGDRDVMHLMSLLSPVRHDMAVAYSRLLPVPFRTWLLDRGLSLIDVPDEEFDSMGTNVLAVAPRRCIVIDGNPRTRSALEHAGVEVLTYRGDEISVKGAGGPTCLTRPLQRLP